MSFKTIGKTTKPVHVRARQLSRETGVPADFAVAYQKEVWDIAQAEDRIFARLQTFCRRNRKEFFEIRLPQAIATADEILTDINSQEPEDLITRRRRWTDFERRMRARDEAIDDYCRWRSNVIEDFPEDVAWMLPDHE